MPLPLNYMNSNFYYVHNFFCVFVHLGLTIFNVEKIKDFRRTSGVCLVRIKLEQMDGDGLQLKNRMHIAREIESSYNDSRK